MTEERLRISGLPNEATLSRFAARLRDPSFGETAAQRFFKENPELFSPLELLEFVRHLRFVKRNMVNPSAVGPREVRVPDFAGVKFFPVSAPVVVELKSPQARILDHSTLGLSAESDDCVGQLRDATIHLLRIEGRAVFEGLGWKVDDAIGEEILNLAQKLEQSGSFAAARDWTSLMRKLQNEGIGLVALIGQFSEFLGQAHIVEKAREEFEDRGCSLLTYDELLLFNEVLVDYAKRATSIYDYFHRERYLRRASGAMYSLDSKEVAHHTIEKFQQLIHRSSGEVCVYGLGAPPAPTQIGGQVLAWRASAYFDVGMLWSPPTHLKGQERLLWAGRLEHRWFVIKERLTDPYKGAVVWYEFGPPVEVEPLFKRRQVN